MHGEEMKFTAFGNSPDQFFQRVWSQPKPLIHSEGRISGWFRTYVSKASSTSSRDCAVSRGSSALNPYCIRCACASASPGTTILPGLVLITVSCFFAFGSPP